MAFALVGQEEEDASFSENNYLFFLSGDERGKTKICIVLLGQRSVSYSYSLGIGYEVFHLFSAVKYVVYMNKCILFNIQTLFNFIFKHSNVC